MVLRNCLLVLAFVLTATACAERTYNDKNVGTVTEKVADDRFQIISTTPMYFGAGSPQPAIELAWQPTLLAAANATVRAGAEAFRIEMLRAERRGMIERASGQWRSWTITMTLGLVVERPGMSPPSRAPRYDAREVLSGKPFPLPPGIGPDPGRRLVQDLMR